MVRKSLAIEYRLEIVSVILSLGNRQCKNIVGKSLALENRLKIVCNILSLEKSEAQIYR